MILIVSRKGITALSNQDYREMLDLASDGRDMAAEYDHGNPWAEPLDPQVNAERDALIDKCSTHL